MELPPVFNETQVFQLLGVHEEFFDIGEHVESAVVSVGLSWQLSNKICTNN